MAKILIIEDEVMINEMLADILKSSGYEIEVAYDGKEGLDKYYQSSFDLIITDIMMPKVDGYQLTKEIRSVNQKIPIFMLTAKTDNVSELSGFELGVTEYVTKPFSLQILLHRIKLQLKQVTQILI